MSKIKNRVALVTGANRGIGQEFVKALIGRGAKKVYAAARNTDTLTNLAQELGENVLPIKVDVTDQATIEQAAKYLDVELLINNAGIAAFEGFVSADNDRAARVEMETNYFGTLSLVRAFAPILKVNGGGTIINMASIASYVSFPVLGSYSASKAALHSLTQGIRAELEEQGTQVTGVYPGPIDTDMAANFPMEKTPADIAVKAILDATEAGEEDVYPDDAAEAMIGQFLSNPKSLEKEAGKMLPQ